MQRIVVAGKTDVARPSWRDIVGHDRHRLAADRAQLPTRVERSHRYFPRRQLRPRRHADASALREDRRAGGDMLART